MWYMPYSLHHIWIIKIWEGYRICWYSIWNTLTNNWILGGSIAFVGIADGTRRQINKYHTMRKVHTLFIYFIILLLLLFCNRKLNIHISFQHNMRRLFDWHTHTHKTRKLNRIFTTDIKKMNNKYWKSFLRH